nr:hypothetical protein [Mammaliicoccus lentus]
MNIKISSVRRISLFYLVYFTVTLFLSPDLFNNEKSDLYKSLLRIIPSQEAWVTVGCLIIVADIISMFFKHYYSAILMNFIYGLFFMMICFTYIMVYPNIGAGIFLAVSLTNFHEIFKDSNKYEDIKAEKLKEKINGEEEIK